MHIVPQQTVFGREVMEISLEQRGLRTHMTDTDRIRLG